MQKYVTFDMSKPLDFIPIGRVAIDFNPTDMYMPLSELLIILTRRALTPRKSQEQKTASASV